MHHSKRYSGLGKDAKLTKRVVEETLDALFWCGEKQRRHGVVLSVTTSKLESKIAQ